MSELELRVALIIAAVKAVSNTCDIPARNIDTYAIPLADKMRNWVGSGLPR